MACHRNQRLKPSPGKDASVLLEVGPGVALFLGAATVITAGINSSIQSVERLRGYTCDEPGNIGNVQIQMHVRPIAPMGPEAFFPPPFEKWKYQILVSQAQDSPLEGEALQNVEVVISHTEENTVQRLSQLFRSGDIAASVTNAPMHEHPSKPGEASFEQSARSEWIYAGGGGARDSDYSRDHGCASLLLPKDRWRRGNW